MHFYELDDEFLPVYSKIFNSKENSPLDIFIHVHYFGHRAGQQRSRDLSDKLGAILIEDCAHIISPNLMSSWKGDFLVFSPHKHFPLPKIGLVIARQPFIVKERNSIEHFPFIWFLKEILKKTRCSKSSVDWKQVWTKQKQKLSAVGCNHHTKLVATSYLAGYLTSAEKRNKHAACLLLQLSSIDGWRPIQAIDRIKSPYLFGMICETADLAKRRFTSLNKRSQLVMQWPDLPMEIKGDQALESQCTKWVEKILFFFNHQQLDIDSLSREIDIVINTDGF